MGNLLDRKGLTTSKTMSLLTTSKTMSLLTTSKTMSLLNYLHFVPIVPMKINTVTVFPVPLPFSNINIAIFIEICSFSMFEAKKTLSIIIIVIVIIGLGGDTKTHDLCLPIHFYNEVLVLIKARRCRDSTKGPK